MSDVKFVHLHVHSEYSLLDGFGTPKNMIKHAKSLGMEALALTDHGAMYGAAEFYKHAKDQGIKPLIGVEAYITNGDHKARAKETMVDTNHLILIAKNEEGYRNLMKLTSIAHVEGYYYRPKVDKETLKKYSKGVICTSGCISGEIASLLLEDNYAKAKETALWFQDVFGEDYYLEIQRHEYEKHIDSAISIEIKNDMRRMAKNEKVIGEGVVKLSRELAIPLVATNDSHYIKAEDADAQDVLVCVATGKLVSETKRIRYVDNPNFYIKSPEEMSNLFLDLPDAIENTVKVAQKCDLKISTYGKWFFPEFPLEDKTADIQLRNEVKEKLPLRYEKVTEEVEERIKHELDIIIGKGYSSYFLIMSDMVEWAYKQGIITNTRGSAAGSIVSYILGITTVDPLYYNLPFERFLNPFRPSPPDIDLDISDNRREEMINYITEKYGKDKVAQICTFGRMLSRAAVRDVSRVLGYPYLTGDKISKLIPPPKQGFPVDVPKALKDSPELKNLYDNDADAKKILDLAHKLEGSARHISVHAAGVVISQSDMTDFTPVQLETGGGKIITQYEMHACEDVGLIKFDMLGIRNLATLARSIKMVKDAGGGVVDIRNIPLDNKKTFEMLARGETMGVFQMGSSGMTKWLKDLKPERIEDLMAMVALYRPGPMQTIPEYIYRKEHPETVEYLDPRMEKFLDKSYGLIVYQDDLLFCALDLAGYTWEEADKFRKAVGKKIPAEMAAQKDKFTKGIVTNGQTEDFAEKLWKLFEPFQAYGFNKAHASSYGIVAYQTAYMKANFPVEFMCALLTDESGDTEKVAEAVAECKRMGIKVLAPDINKSQVGFTIEEVEGSLENKGIRFGLSAIKNVGEAAIETIIEGRKDGSFRSFGDFFVRVDARKVNKKVLESLIKAGSFDSFGSRAALLAGIDAIRDQVSRLKKSVDGQDSLFSVGQERQEEDLGVAMVDNLPIVEEFSKEEKLSLERELLGLYLSEHPLANALSSLGGRVTHKVGDLSRSSVGQSVVLAGMIATARVVTTKNGGKQMAFATLEDETGTIEMVVFPQTFAKTRVYWESKQPVVINGKVEYREDALSLIVDKIRTVEEVLATAEEKVVEMRETLSAGPQMLRIPRGTSPQVLLQINSILKSNKGDSDLTILVENNFGEKRIKVPYGVAWSPRVQGQIKKLLS
ncbi:MAG: DNA polymerase III subunit alpha [bacterium]|nr:DNA polymerase III subunit alpha [bacterium]